MARDPKHVQADLLTYAIEQARPLLRWPINRVELEGSIIRVEANGEAVFFQVNQSQSHSIDEVTGQAVRLAGGDRYHLIQIPQAKDAEAAWRKSDRSSRRFWRR